MAPAELESQSRLSLDLLQGHTEASAACKMIELLVPESELRAIKASILGGDVEKSVVALASQLNLADGRTRLLVRELIEPTSTEYESQSSDRVVLKPEFVARVTKLARIRGLSIVFAHSHPGSSPPVFSITDNEGERHLSEFLARRHPNSRHVALVASEGGVRARELGTNERSRVVSLGEFRTILCEPGDNTSAPPEIFDRQIRAFGLAGQKALSTLRVAIVGLGGTGSIAVQQLVHLGVRDFFLVDPDDLESSNLNRVVGARPEDVGRSKVEIAECLIKRVAPDASVRVLKGDVIRAKVARELANSDIMFGCTDSHGSRAVLQQVAYQYFVPCFDIGTMITASSGRVTGIFGRVQLLAPGFACLSCSELLNPEEVRRDMMSAFERKLDPYIQGEREPAPAVISINGTAVSLAVTMFMSYITGIPTSGRYLVYNGMTTALRRIRVEPKADCYMCSLQGVLARGDLNPLYARQD